MSWARVTLKKERGSGVGASGFPPWLAEVGALGPEVS